MPRHVSLPRSLGAAFTVRDAREAGVGYGRTRGHDLIPVFHGVRAALGSLDADWPEARIRRLAHAYAPRLADGQFFCEATALALLGLPLPLTEPTDRVHVGVRSPLRSPRTRGVVGHGLREPRLVSVGGLPVLAPLDAWSQSAARLGSRDLVIIGDGLVRRRLPLANLIELAEHVRSKHGSRGFRRLESAGSLVRAGTDSAKETVIRLLIVEAGLPEPLVNAAIRDAFGRFLGLGDLVFREWNVVVEYDGGYHFASDRQIHQDIDRLARFTAAGMAVVRVHKYHLTQPTTILARIRAALVAAGWVEPSRTVGRAARLRNL